MSKIYVYEEVSGKYFYSDAGSDYNNIIFDIPSGCNFTMKEPPNSDETWRWIDDKWIADQPS